MEDNILKGTTTIGLVCNDGVVLASERRATMGYLIANKDAQKIYQIDDTVGMTTAGAVGDAQRLVRIISVESSLYRMRTKEPMTVRAMANLLSSVLGSSRMFPFYVQLLLGGVDKTGPCIYSLDALGGRLEERKAVSTGSGSPIAYGILEDRYREGISTDEGADLAVRALHNVMKRDVASGDGIDVVISRKGEYIRLGADDIKKKIEKLGN
ncbi:MAG: archaeal proteasome endopeptidase complex subunit beta [Methanosarcinales archaeon]|nr:archaeal proteasome endopeptidase complex subunit beta [Methanosarcinales archaeon]